MNATFASVRPVHVSDADSLAALYIARLLQRQIVPIRVFNDSLYTEEIRALVGISPSEGNIPKVKALQLLKAQLPQLATMTEKRTQRLQRNIRMLGRLLSLTDIEEAILTFFVLMDHHFVLADLLSNVVIMDKDALVRFMSVALSIEREIINAYVQSSSTLFATGLLAQELRPERIGVNIKIPRGIKDALLSEADSIESLMKVVLEPSPKPTLRAHDFEHLDSETELLHTYLAEGLQQGVTGINVLIYGPPGTGKTEYARWLASSIKTSLYQVRACNDSEDSISGSDRLSYFRLSQRFLQCSTALILFDEIEDVFPDPDMVSPSSLAAQKWPGKLFINRLLETNPVPTIWIANEISHIDKAYLRRFDYSIELAIPPIQVRRRIAKRHLQKHRLPPTFLEHLAQQDELSAALQISDVRAHTVRLDVISSLNRY
jgi:transitional endoplasmic reticulum ATPase